MHARWMLGLAGTILGGSLLLEACNDRAGENASFDLAIGDACNTDSQCASGVCVISACCVTDCQQTCAASPADAGACCVGEGEKCSDAADCCSGDCNGGACQAS
jgi:hypothetical protein